MNQPTDHSTNRPTNYRAANQPKVEQTYLTTFNTGDYDPPCLAYFFVKEGREGKGREKWVFKLATNWIC